MNLCRDISFNNFKTNVGLHLFLIVSFNLMDYVGRYLKEDAKIELQLVGKTKVYRFQ